MLYSALFTGYIIASVCISNLIIIFISIFYKIDNNDRFKFIDELDKLHNDITALSPLIQIKWSKKIIQLKLKNICKTIFMNLFNLCLMIMLLIITVTFTSAFPIWQNHLVILWSSTIITDFILVEALFEVFIWLFWVCRKNYSCISQFLIGIKNLRNIY